jgi:hypothetical protein
MILMLLVHTFLGGFPNFMVLHNLRWLDAAQRNMASMLWIQVDVVVADMEGEVVVKVDELVMEVEEELTLMASIFWTRLTNS